MSNIPFRFSLLWTGLLLWLLGAGMSPAQSTSPHNSALTVGQRQVIVFSGNWKTEQGLALEMPFVWEQDQPATFIHPFVITNDSILPDTLMLYISGWSQQGEVWLNDRLLGVMADPFAEYLYPIPREWIVVGKDTLKAVLSYEGKVLPGYPVPEIGIFRENSLLIPDSTEWQPLWPNEVEKADSILMVAPWNEAEGYGISERWMLFVLQELRAQGIRHLHFPFRAPPAFYRHAANLNFILVAKPFACENLAWYNEYPVAGLKFSPNFWKDATGNRKQDVYRYEKPENLSGRWQYPPGQTPLVILLLLPFLGLAIFRLIDPKTFEGTLEYLTKSKIYLDLIQNNKLVKSEGSLALSLLRIFIVSVGAGAYLYYIQCIGQPESLNLITSESLLFELIRSGPYSFQVLFLMCFGLLSVVSLLKYMAVYGTSVILRLNFFPSHIPNLDIFASFPATPLLVLPAWFIFFADGTWASVLLIIWQVIILAYVLRRMLAIFQGLGVLYSFPLSLKILYICTLEILPWFFLL